MMQCSNCKAAVDDDALFCTHCASDLANNQPDQGSLKLWSGGSAPAGPGNTSSRNRIWVAIGAGATLLFLMVVAVVIASLYLYLRGSTTFNPVSTSRPASSSEPAATSKADIHIVEMHTAMNDSSVPGQEGDTTNTFSPSDHTIHCVATLNRSKTGTNMRFVWSRVDASGGKDAKIYEFEYTTKPSQKVVGGYVVLSIDWPMGRYKCDAYIEGNRDKTVEFKVE